MFWENTISTIISKYYPEDLDQSQGFQDHALFTLPNEEGAEQFIIFPELHKYRKFLEQQNSQLDQLENRFIISDLSLIKT